MRKLENTKIDKTHRARENGNNGQNIDSNWTPIDIKNPLFKRSLNNNKNSKNSGTYDNTSFNKEILNAIDNKNSQKKLSTDEMELGMKGVENFGYANETKRPDSWESDYSEIDNKNSKDQINAYDIPPDRGPLYEDLAVIKNNRSINDNLEMKKSIGGNKKRNLIYEPSEFKNSRTTSGSKKANVIYESSNFSKNSPEKRPSNEQSNFKEEKTNCCHLLITILIGLLVIIAIIVILLMVFGTIAMKCKDCDDLNSGPATSAQQLSSNLAEELSIIKTNLSKLQNDIQKNQSVTISNLQDELEGYKILVSNLQIELDGQKNLTELLNKTVSNVTFIIGPEGPQGLRGYNGTTGLTGPTGTNLSSCEYKQSKSNIPANSQIDDVNSFSDFSLSSQNRTVLSATCLTENFDFAELSYESERQRYKCHCQGHTQKDTIASCYIHYWHCIDL